MCRILLQESSKLRIKIANNKTFFEVIVLGEELKGRHFPKNMLWDRAQAWVYQLYSGRRFFSKGPRYFGPGLAMLDADCCFLSHRQCEVENRPAAHLRSNADCPSVRLHDGLRNGQSHACSLDPIPLVTPAIELLEDQ